MNRNLNVNYNLELFNPPTINRAVFVSNQMPSGKKCLPGESTPKLPNFIRKSEKHDQNIQRKFLLKIGLVFY